MKLFNKKSQQPVVNAESPANGYPAAEYTEPQASNYPVGDNAKPVVVKKHKTHPVVFLFLLLLVAGLAAAATYTVLKFAASSTKQTETTAPVTQAPQATAKIDAAAAIAAVKPKLTNTAPTTDAPILALQVAGYDFMTSVTDKAAYTGIHADVTPADNAVKVAEVGKVLKDKGFSEEINTTNSDATYEARYKGADAACFVGSLGSVDNPKAAHVVSVMCADMTAFKAVAAQQKPLVAALPATYRATTGTAFYGAPTVKASKTAGYTIAMLGVSAANVPAGINGLQLYQAPDKTWHYVTQTGDTGPGPECKDFATDDAKKAFLGESCAIVGSTGETTMSTVK